MSKIKATDYITDVLVRKGVRCVFELSGGMITHLLDSLNRDGRIAIISMRHEQAAAFAADACGRMRGVPGVALATSGPGAINLLTGVGSCYFDSSPAVFVTGQVNRDEQKANRKIRQLGFQESDIVSMARPVTKAAWRIESSEELPAVLERAFAVAVEGRPGPVLIDIPMDVQRSLIVPPANSEAGGGLVKPEPPRLDYLLAALVAARRPLILAGGGVRAGRAIDAFRQLVDSLGVPVVNSLMGVDLLPNGHPLRVGMIGTYGNRWANLALGQSDFLLVLGSRLDVRQTGSRTAEFKGTRTIFHVDCEPGEINNRVKGCQAVVCELAVFLRRMAEAAEQAWGSLSGRWPDWRADIEELHLKWPDTKELNGVSGINPNRFMHQLSAVSGSAAAYVVDVGQHQMWAGQSIEIGPEQRFLTSGGMGSMGFALPAAIGASLSCPGRPVVAIAGDGGFQCNIQELQTVVQLRLPLKLVVLNNHCLGMVRQFQDSYFGGRYQSTYWGYSAPDFAKVASAYGIPAASVARPESVESSLRWLWEAPDQPRLLEVMIDTFTNVYPKIAFGRPISEMEPFSEPVEMESRWLKKV